MLFPFFKDKETGVALPSVFFAMVGSLGLFLAINGTLNNRQLEGTLFSLKLFQKLTHEKVISSAANPVNLFKSVATRSFRNCLQDTGTRNCRSTNWINFSSKQYYNGMLSAPSTISGSRSYFNIRGVLCQRGDDRSCPLKSDTWYKINCHNGLSTCNVAESISIAAQIDFDRRRFKNDKINTGERFKLRKFPLTATDIQYNVFPSDIIQAIYQECPSGANAIGMDSRGIMQCMCAPGFKKVDVAGVKLTCVPINTSGSLLGNQEIIDKTVLADGVDIKCNASKYHKLVSLSGLGECGLQGDKNKVGSKVVCSKKGIQYRCIKFQNEHQWAKE